MKYPRIRPQILIFLLLCAVMITAAEAALLPGCWAEETQAPDWEKKKPGECWLDTNLLSGEYAANYEEDPRVVSADGGWKLEGIFPEGASHDAGLREPVQYASLVQVSGDEALKDAFILDGTESLQCNMGRLETAGEAAYLLRLMSEHYRHEVRFTARFFDIRQVEILSEIHRLTVPQDNQEVYLSHIVDKSAVSVSPKVETVGFMAMADGEFNFDCEEYSVHVGRITGKKAGDYPIQLLVCLGENRAAIPFDITLHVNNPGEDRAAAEQERAAEQAENEAKGIEYRTAKGEFTGTETVRGRCNDLEAVQPIWLYLPSSLPDKVESSQFGAHIYLDTPEGERLVPDTYSVEFLSGNESFRDALVFQEQHTDEIHHLQLLADNRQLEETGEAVFRIRLKAGEVYGETDYTLRVLDWAEYPAFEFLRPDLTLYVNHGKENDSMYTVSYLLGELAADHLPRIRAELGLDSPPAEYKSLRPEGNYTNEQIIGDDVRMIGDYFRICPFYQFLEAGIYRFRLSIYFGNFHCYQNVTVRALPYSVSGPDVLRPGDSAHYTVTADSSGEDPRCRLEAEGEYIDFDAETGLLSVREDASEGAAFTVAAIPENGEPASTLEVRVSESLLFGGARAETVPLDGSGFHVPLFMSGGFDAVESGWILCSKRTDAWTGRETIAAFDLLGLEKPVESPEDALRACEDVKPLMREVTGTETIEMDGYPALLRYGRSEGWDDLSYSAEICWARGKQILRVILQHCAPEGTSRAGLVPVSPEDVRFVLGKVSCTGAGP